MKTYAKRSSVAWTLSGLVLTLLAVALAAMTALVSRMTSTALSDAHLANMAEQTRTILDTIAAFQASLEHDVSRLHLSARYPGEAVADVSRSTPLGALAVPELRVGDVTLNGDAQEVNAFTSSSGAVATIFVRAGDDFVRVATSLQNAAGARATGTLLDRSNPAYERLLAGETYVGTAVLFGRRYITKYEPIRAAGGSVVGAWFVGLDFDDRLAALKARIRATKIGETGYFYVLDATPGADYGNFVVHPTLEGKSALGLRDDVTGREYIKDILATKRGTTRYMFTNRGRGETDSRAKIVAYDFFPAWNWVVVTSSYESEATARSVALRTWMIVVAVVVLLVLGSSVALVVNRVVRRPLLDAVRATRQIAGGDLHCRIEVASGDEIGQLMASLRDMTASLSKLVSGIRASAESIVTASQQIAAGNDDLSRRTELQVASLEQTAGSVEELTATVQRNAENAEQTSVLARAASDKAAEGGRAVTTFMDTMSAISASSKRIADIVGTIDGLAFQTNILALNAAVEAARAGEEGRGFAVVAAEVRELAKQSASAAKEIHALIADEASKVDAGSAHVGSAQATIGEVVAAIRRVAEILLDVAEASKQQSVGVAQVNQAVAGMDRSTQQNAALVEQAAAAAGSLHDQARHLNEAVAIFR